MSGPFGGYYKPDSNMSNSRPNQLRQVVKGIGALLLLIVVVGALLYGLSTVLTGGVGGAVAGGLVGLAVALASKAFEHQKQRDSAIAEKKREVYRRLLAPWEHLLVEIKAGKQGDDLLQSLDLASVYAGAFDAVLYGSETVVQLVPPIQRISWRGEFRGPRDH